MIGKALYSSNSDNWSTPQSMYDDLNAEFSFDLDACATEGNAKCSDYYTPQQDGLKADWGGAQVFCNPPYSNIKAWAEKAFRETRTDNTLVAMLIPARTDTRWFHDYIYHRAEVY